VTAPLRAVLFDVGDTLVDTATMPEDLSDLLRASLRREFGERDWYPRWIAGKLAPPRTADGDLAAIAAGDEELFRQETIRWYEEWFRSAGILIDDIDLDRLRSTMCVPLDRVTTPIRGAFDAVRWCKAQGLAVVIVSNTLSRGDEESWVDMRRLGLADTIDGLVTSHSVGWQKPHRQIFERALEIARVRPDEAVMVGDRMLADIWGAKRLGMRAVLRRTAATDQAPVDVTPDATIDDLTELPAVLSAWLGSPSAQRSLRP
jgi:FMN hydrolase / 5-amino-6-(5-phospho-D-ribitylamino)uracil phosphatase